MRQEHLQTGESEINFQPSQTTATTAITIDLPIDISCLFRSNHKRLELSKYVSKFPEAIKYGC